MDSRVLLAGAGGTNLASRGRAVNVIILRAFARNLPLPRRAREAG